MMHKFLSASPIYQDLSLAFIRILTGLLMVYHGWEIFDAATMKGYLEWDMFKNPSGNTMIYLGKGAELVSGILLTLGLLTRLGALMLLFSMTYIAFFVGHGKVWYGDQHPFMFVLLAIIYLSVGGGPYSLDKRLFQ